MRERNEKVRSHSGGDVSLLLRFAGAHGCCFGAERGVRRFAIGGPIDVCGRAGMGLLLLLMLLLGCRYGVGRG